MTTLAQSQARAEMLLRILELAGIALVAWYCIHHVILWLVATAEVLR